MAVATTPRIEKDDQVLVVVGAHPDCLPAARSDERPGEPHNHGKGRENPERERIPDHRREADVSASPGHSKSHLPGLAFSAHCTVRSEKVNDGRPGKSVPE
jgi:hypothetical protein